MLPPSGAVFQSAWISAFTLSYVFLEWC